MSETKHTPGPWSGHRTGILRGHEWVVSNAPDEQGNIMSEANARLIAAAPDLLELATALLSAIEMFAITNTSDEDTIGVLADAAREVIDKAQGAA